MSGWIPRSPSIYFNGPPSVQTGTTYTISPDDYGKIVTFSNASAVTVTLPQQSTA